ETMLNLAWSPHNYDDDDIDKVISGVGSGLLWKQNGNMVQVHIEGTTGYATGSFKDFQLYESGIITPWVMTEWKSKAYQTSSNVLYSVYNKNEAFINIASTPNPNKDDVVSSRKQMVGKFAKTRSQTRRQMADASSNLHMSLVSDPDPEPG
ncbi:hypothetical protein Tco_1330880, partial [Tanacetum coccineum]